MDFSLPMLMNVSVALVTRTQNMFSNTVQPILRLFFPQCENEFKGSL